ncbi:histone-lysine N-methyltransferase ASHR1 isoform X2 [Nicotiana sylvestris]|uniref:Histone-lysine N-methyltransferase ASHR1 isoform X2 n=1 Tax=Nicotiana sylvestris TaxID=4096 RepID=A0A1U7V952_NICSY|nr:PREDICTED: histone-lysine N-methyltransferase ASHR1 isoform X2 [Nicotiana sylvestris]
MALQKKICASSMEELQKALSDKGLTVSPVPEKGRCLFTTRDFSPGEVIIWEEPYVSVPNKSSAKCEWCFTSTNLKRCSACHVVYYCGNTCQKSDWKLHRVECKALSKVDKERIKSLTPSVRLMVKLYLRRKLQDEKVIPATVLDNFNLVESLVSHIADIDEKQLVLYAQMANLVNLILQRPEMSIKEIAEKFSKFSCNAHTICDAELKPLGTGLYPLVSIINHSCLPNSVLIFEGRMAVVRAVQHIPKGTEVLISYIEMAGSTATRQKALSGQYFFSCTCIRCIKLGQNDDIQESAVLEGYRCKDKRCSGFLLRDSGNKGFRCQLCGLFRDREEIKIVVNEMESMSEKASFSLSNGHASVMYKMIEKLQQKLYHQFSVNLMRTRENLLKILMELQDWKEALKYCRLTIPVYKRVYPECHPLLGLQYYTCGKLEWWLGETGEAYRSLAKAAEILRITHGTNTNFMKELFVKIEEARAEFSYRISSTWKIEEDV